MKRRLCLGGFAAVTLLALCSAELHAQQASRHAYVWVVIGKDLPGPVSGDVFTYLPARQIRFT